MFSFSHHGSPPQILIDLKEIAHNFVQTDEIGLILGGRYDYYNKMLSMFLDNLKKTGAKLVFFMPGKKYTDDLPFFIPKSEDNYAESLKILDEIEKNSNRNSLQEMLKAKNKYSSDIRMELSFNYNLKKLVHRFTNVNDVHTNHIRHNQEIARYANEHADEVLAVISNDTDFLAFEGEFEYWRANGINYKQLTALQYDKQKLHERFDFELGAFQMQLLSALCGSNFLPVYTIRDWIDRLEESNNDPLVRGKILNVAAYVKCQEPIDHDEKGKPIFDFEKISRDVFGEKFSEAQKNAITNCYASYNLDFEEEMSNSGYQDPAQRDSFLKFCKSHDLFLYKLATDDVFNVKDITFMDFRNFKSKSYAELVIPILMKICGILNKDARRRPNVRSICMKHAHDEPFKQTEETIIYPPSSSEETTVQINFYHLKYDVIISRFYFSVSLPPLFDLIFKNKERKYDRDRWPLFEWILDLDEGFLQQLRAKIDIQRFFACIVTLHYLVQVIFRPIFEIRFSLIFTRSHNRNKCVFFIARGINRKRSKCHSIHRTQNAHSNFQSNRIPIGVKCEIHSNCSSIRENVCPNFALFGCMRSP